MMEYMLIICEILHFYIWKPQLQNLNQHLVKVIVAGRATWPLNSCFHDDVIKWKHFPRYWPFVWGIHRSPVNSPHKGQWRGALMFSLICAGTNIWANNGDAGDLRRHRAHNDVIVMPPLRWKLQKNVNRIVRSRLNCLSGSMGLEIELPPSNFIAQGTRASRVAKSCIVQRQVWTGVVEIAVRWVGASRDGYQINWSAWFATDSIWFPPPSAHNNTLWTE